MKRFVMVARSLVFLSILVIPAAPLHAAANWGVDLGGSSLQLDVHAYADNGANGIRPGPGAWYEDDNLPGTTVFGVQPPFTATFFGQDEDMFDLGALAGLSGRDTGVNPFFDTFASNNGVIGIRGVGTGTLEIFWRSSANGEQSGLGGEGFLSDSEADLTAQIVATIDGVAPGTPLTIGYDWQYLGDNVGNGQEAVAEDPTSANGSLTFVDEQGTGPGNLFSEAFFEPPGPLGGADNDNDSYDLTTSMTANPSFLTIDLDSSAHTMMQRLGDPPANSDQIDTVGSFFVGRLTLTLTEYVPEPSSLTLSALALLGLFGLRRKRG